MTLIVVERIVSRREFGSIFAGRDETGALVRIKAGKDAIIGVPEVGEVWSVEGETEVTAWGRQIKATHALRSLPNGRLMVDYLSGSVVGIGPTRAPGFGSTSQTNCRRRSTLAISTSSPRSWSPTVRFSDRDSLPRWWKPGRSRLDWVA